MPNRPDLDKPTAAVLDYLTTQYGIPAAHVKGFTLTSESTGSTVLNASLYVQRSNGHPKIDKLADDIRQAARDSRRLDPIGERTVVVPLLGSTRDEQPRAEVPLAPAPMFSQLPECPNCPGPAVPHQHQVAVSLPRRTPGAHLEDEMALCAYVVGTQKEMIETPDGPEPIGRLLPVLCSQPIAYHEDNDGKSWWYHTDPHLFASPLVATHDAVAPAGE